MENLGAASAPRSLSASRSRQLFAILYKNFLLQTRSSRRFFGLRSSGVATVLLEWLIPVLFILAMYPLKRFLAKIPFLPVIFKETPLQNSDWGHVYSGPTFQNASVPFSPRLLLAPDTPEVRVVAGLLGKALVCGRASYIEPGRQQDFKQFWQAHVPSDCKFESTYCQEAPECVRYFLEQQVDWADDERAVAELLLEHPEHYDAAVVFGDDALEYTIRMNHTLWDFVNRRHLHMPSSQDLFSDVALGQIKVTVEPDSQYKAYFFFANLQLALDRALIVWHLGGDENDAPIDIQVKTKAFPWPEKLVDVGGVLAGFLFIFLLVFAFQQPTRNVVTIVVREKELRLREYMYILGLTDGAYWASWWFTHSMMLGVSGLLCAFVGLYPFPNSSLWVMIAFYWSVSSALITFAYCIASLFSSARVASLVAPLLYALAMIPGFLAVTTQAHGGVTWYLASLLPPSAMILFAFSLISWEVNGQGINSHTAFASVTPSIYFSAAAIIGMLLLDSVLYFALMLLCDWYSHGHSFSDAVVDAYHSLFGRARSNPSADGSRLLASEPNGSDITGQTKVDDDAGGSDRSDVAIHMQKLTRAFATECGTKLAVDSLELDIYANQITALLGHNGAGKSTTISMLTGMIPPSSGQALIGGRDIRTSMSRIRQSLGVCPQFDILWPILTVREHLELYAALRGFDAREVKRTAREAAANVDLTSKLDCPTSDLSGGQKRKLSVAISLLGTPEVVFLDEPTSGMDPQARRFIWDVIRRAKVGRAIVLTTHSMDEADMLCDRIAIMTNGRLAAVGSSLHLKALYGAGYTLTIVRDRCLRDAAPGSSSAAAGSPSLQEHSPPASVASMASAAVDTGVQDIVRRHVPAALAVSDAGDEISFQLPQSHVHAFPALLRAINDEKEALRVRSYGISVTTMEEVFLRVACDSDASLRTHLGSGALGTSTSGRGGAPGRPRASWAAPAPPAPSDALARRPPWLQSARVWARQFWACFCKQSIAARRERWAVITQLTVPLLLVVGAVYMGTKRFTPESDPPLLLDKETALDGWGGVLGATEECRNETMFAHVAGILTDTYGYRDTQSRRLDPALWPRMPPRNGTLDAQIRAEWYQSKHIYDAVFLEQLPRTDNHVTPPHQPPQQPRPPPPLGPLHAERPAPSLNQTPGDDPGQAPPGAVNGSTTAPTSRLAAQVGSSGERDDPLVDGTYVYTVLNNETAKHALPVTINAVNNAILDHLLARRGDRRRNLLTAWFHPYPVVDSEEKVRVSKENAQMSLAVYVMMAMSVLSASFVVVPVKERASGSRHVQIVSGLMPSALWTSTFAWDLLNYAVPVSAILACFLLVHVPGISGDNLGVVTCLLAVFGLAALPQTYLWHYLFADEMRALVRLSSANFLLGFLGFAVTFILDTLVKFGLPSVRDSVSVWDHAIKGVLRLASPHYLLMCVLYRLVMLAPGKDPWAWDVSGRELAWLAVQAAALAATMLVVSSGWLGVVWWRLRRLRTKAYAGGADDNGLLHGINGGRDDDVVAHARMVAHAEPKDFAVMIRDATKLYNDEWLSWQKPVRAVDGVSIAIKPGACFGLCGSNGAGKTTVFRMLTHQLRPSGGDIWLAGHSVTTDPAHARRCSGYCPQFGGLSDSLTGRELLTFYARLRGVAAADIPTQVAELLQRLSLTEHADLACGLYSGGSRRKLSVAVALVGGPPILLLDEPSTGMDPAARRSLWMVLQDAQRIGHTIVMTSHMMEECDVLCSSVAILVRGTVRCLGTTQELKMKYDGGYVLEARLPRERHRDLVEALQRAFPRAVIAASGERWSDVACLALQQDGLDVPALFEFAERERGALEIGTYAVSQGTLEHVFMRIAEAAGGEVALDMAPEQ